MENELLDYQREGVKFLLSRDAAILGDEMGLGKTAQAIEVINQDPSAYRVLIVCPASLKGNWIRELKTWLRVPLSVGLANGTIPWANITVINYDILHKHDWSQHAFDIAIFDECHYLKNGRARRTKHGLSIKASRTIFLSGTPMVNRPIELYPLLKAIDPEKFNSRWSFAKRYCALHQTRWGWDTSGSSNEAELHRLIKPYMLRRAKAEVLKDLPPKRRQIVELSGDPAKIESAATAAIKRALVLEQEIASLDKDKKAYAKAVAELGKARKEAHEHVMRVRHETALAKVPSVVEFVKNAVASSGAVVLFAHHRDVIGNLREGLAEFKPLVLTGDTPIKHRQGLVDAFQRANSPHRVFIGNIQAAGVGLTLTRASHVIFAELDWVPGVMTQAEDRCHRIGQMDFVLVQHLVLEKSLDASIARTLVRKQATLDRVLDGKAPVAAEQNDNHDWLEAFRQAKKETKNG